MGERSSVIGVVLLAAVALLEAAVIYGLLRDERRRGREHDRRVNELLEREAGLLDRISDLAGRPWTPSPASIIPIEELRPREEYDANPVEVTG